MRIGIIGPGALGSLMAMTLARTAARSRLLLLDHRRQRAVQLARNGIAMQQNGQETAVSIPVSADPEAAATCDILLLCVKSGAVADALARLQPFLHTTALVIGMQNGIGHLDILHRLPCSAAAGVTTSGATMIRTGLIRHGGSGSTRLGMLSATDADHHTRLQWLASMLAQGGMSTETVDDIIPYIWGKLFINVGINALTAIQGCTNGQLLTSCMARNTMKQAVMEALAIANAQAIAILEDPVQATFRVCRRTRNNISSMLQDIRNRRPTEIDAVNGAVVRQGERLNIPTPVNRHLVRQIKALEASWQKRKK